jgi:hypothetical protein
MNEIYIIILTAIVGVVGTILTQAITRHMRLPEVKHKQSLENLQCIKFWIEAYRALFKCQYPMAIANDIFALANHHSSDDKIASKRIYSALQQYQDVNEKYNEAERVGRPSFISFTKTKGRDTFFDTSLRDRFISAIYHFDSDIPVEYRMGLPRKIYPHLKTIERQRYKLFESFPDSLFSVDWEKLDFIEPENVILIIHKTSLGEKWPGSLEERHQWKSFGYTIWNDLEGIQRTALYAIDDILNIIREYESKLLLEIGTSNEK